MVELITEKPAWYILLCILLGGAYAFTLYYKETGIPSERRWLKPALAVLRGMLVTLLAFLLLTPLIKTFSREVEKPLIVLAQDNSESIAAGKDSAFIRTKYTPDFLRLADRLRSAYDVKTVSWGDEVKEATTFAYNEKVTDFSAMLDELDARYANRNLGALVIATDGLYNRGANPLYNAPLKVPYYMVALGDTVVRKDVRIGDIRYNKTVFLGNAFPVEVTVDARQAAGAQVTLTVSEDSAVLFSGAVNITNNRFSRTMNVLLDASRRGMHHYRVQLSRLPGEVSPGNNERDIYIEVKESKEKILILAQAPHPDIAALKMSIESSQNYEARPVLMEKFDGKTDGYSLVIFHQLPSTKYPLQDLPGRLAAAGISAWYILGDQTSLSLFNKTGAGLTIASSLEKTNAATAFPNPDFSFFTLSEETRKTLTAFPPLNVPFGDYRSTAAGSPVLFQQIGSVSTRAPLLLVGGDRTKTAVLSGEGFWRWRLSDYSAHGNFQVSQEIIQKVVQYLASHEQKSRFRIHHKSSIPENEPVLFDAEVYNESFELVNAPDVNLVVKRRDKSFPYTFSKTDKAYSLNAGYFQPGEYSYRATVKTGDGMQVKEGLFTVVALQQELIETTADHALLESVATKTGGTVFRATQLDQLADSLLARDLKPVSYSNYKLRDLIHLKWVFFLILALLSLEWFARKRSGGY